MQVTLSRPIVRCENKDVGFRCTLHERVQEKTSCAQTYFGNSSQSSVLMTYDFGLLLQLIGLTSSLLLFSIAEGFHGKTRFVDLAFSDIDSFLSLLASVWSCSFVSEAIVASLLFSCSAAAAAEVGLSISSAPNDAKIRVVLRSRFNV